MPNWCNNYAHFTCPNKEMYDKLNDAISNDEWFETFAPLDETINENDWVHADAINTWNTKWTPSNVEIIATNDALFVIELTFDTAWSPPTGVYKIMNTRFDISTTSYYCETGCGFFGRCWYSKEEELDETFDIPSNIDELNAIKKVIGEDLDEYMSSTWELLEQDE